MLPRPRPLLAALVATCCTLAWAGCEDEDSPANPGPGQTQPAARPDQLLPDLVQAVPQNVTVQQRDGGWYVGFRSAVANTGRGPLTVLGSRTSEETEMRARQEIRRIRGRPELGGLVGTMRYTISPDHQHWHLLGFDRYELRSAADGTRVQRDRKSGFCLGDREALKTASGRPRTPQAFPGNCGVGETELRFLRQGISPGWIDPYAAYLEGQELEVTGLPAGRYVLIHRVNSDRALIESDYAKNAASVLIELTGDDTAGRQVRVLKRCFGTADCA